MNEDSTQEIINRIKQLRSSYQESEDINKLNLAYSECQKADDQGIDVSWYFPWIMYDYLKRTANENIKGYLHTLDVIQNKGFFTNGSIPLTVQKTFIVAVQNNICGMAWKLKEERDFTTLFALYDRGIKYFSNFDENLIENTELFHRDKSQYYGKKGFFEALLNTLFASKEIPKNEEELNQLINRFKQVNEYFDKNQIPYYHFLVAKIIRTIMFLAWNYYKLENEQLLNQCAIAYSELNVKFPLDINNANVVLPFIQKYKGKDNKYSDSHPENFIMVVDLLDFDRFSTEDYEKYQGEDGKKYPGLVERVLISYLKAESKSAHSPQQMNKIIEKVRPILKQHNDYIWPSYFYCQILLQDGIYEEAREVGLSLVRNNLANPNMWGLLAITYRDNFIVRMACLYQACIRGTMVQKIRKHFIDGLIAMQDPAYYSIIKREVLRLNNKEQAQQYKNLSWFNNVQEASEDDKIQQFDAVIPKILYPEAKPCRFYVDWQNDHDYWIGIPNADEAQFIRKKIRKKLVDKILKNGYAYSAILISYDDDLSKVKFVGNVNEVKDAEFKKLYMKEDSGTFSAVHDFGFIVKDDQALDEDYFCNSKIVKENNLQNYDTIKFLAKYSFDKKQDEWKWELYKIQKIEHANPVEFQRTFQGPVTIKKNKAGHIFGFVNSGENSCYVPEKLLTKAGIKDDNVNSLKILAEKKYNGRDQKWEWSAVTIQEVN